jgi:low temperature requirement protein LtrA
MLWLASAAVPEPARYILWAAGFLVEAATPAVAGERLQRGPAIHASHLPERFGLFVIIVLGESVGAVGLGLSDVESSARTTLSAVACFVLAAALWWDYFDFGSWSALRGLLASPRRGAYARDIYSYGHLPVVIGIAAMSVGAEQAIAHSGDAALSVEVRWALAAGLAAYLLGIAGMHAAMARETGDPAPRMGLAAVALALALAIFGGDFAPLLFLALIVALVVGQIAFERRVDGGGSRLDEAAAS